MKINYTVMPDLKLGDGQVQIMVANYDTDKVRQWYELYQQSMLNRGETVADLNEIDMETYQKTAEMSTEEYINTGDETVKEANQKYENEKTSAEKVQLAENQMDYDYYEGNQMYQKFTINKDVLVKPIEDKIPEGFQDYFVSKVPGTYGKEIQWKASILSWIGRIFRLIQQSGKNPKDLQGRKDINIRFVSYITQKQ